MQDEFCVLVEACCVGIGLAHFWYKIPNLLRHSVDERRFRRVRSIQSRFLIPHRILWDCIDVFNQADRSRLSGMGSGGNLLPPLLLLLPLLVLLPRGLSATKM